MIEMIVCVQHDAYRGKNGKRHGNRYFYLGPDGCHCTSSAKESVRRMIRQDFGVPWSDVQLVHVDSEELAWRALYAAGLRRMIAEVA